MIHQDLAQHRFFYSITLSGYGMWWPLVLLLTAANQMSPVKRIEGKLITTYTTPPQYSRCKSYTRPTNSPTKVSELDGNSSIQKLQRPYKLILRFFYSMMCARECLESLGPRPRGGHRDANHTVSCIILGALPLIVIRGLAFVQDTVGATSRNPWNARQGS